MARRTAFAIAALAVLCAGFIALGSWQVQRRAWKHELIERVNSRVTGPAVSPPGRADWPKVSAARDEYRRLKLAGTWLVGHSTPVQAVTERGSGFWILSPLRTTDGGIVLVNRGFVLPEARDPAQRRGCLPAGPVEVTGLLRVSEPGGGFLRHNEPASDRWFSRDVDAIAAKRELPDDVAPFFIDAEATPNAPPNCPVGGLTVVSFHDNHAVYALTWFALALMCVGGMWVVQRRPAATA